MRTEEVLLGTYGGGAGAPREQGRGGGRRQGYPGAGARVARCEGPAPLHMTAQENEGERDEAGGAPVALVAGGVGSNGAGEGDEKRRRADMARRRRCELEAR